MVYDRVTKTGEIVYRHVDIWDGRWHYIFE